MNVKLEVVIIPVSDIDRAKPFYEKLGFRLDIDIVNENFRQVHGSRTARHGTAAMSNQLSDRKSFRSQMFTTSDQWHVTSDEHSLSVIPAITGVIDQFAVLFGAPLPR